MTKVTIISGFLGAGKTTLIKKLVSEVFASEKLVIIENEFGEIGIDGGFLKESGIQITEMNSGCICCSLVGDFSESLKEVLNTYSPDRVIIEPSGVGKLSDVMNAVVGVASEVDVEITSSAVVVDAIKCKMYMKNFGEFFNNQVEHAGTIILSRSQNVPAEKLEECVALLRGHNDKASIITTPWEELDGAKILEAMEHKDDFAKELMAEEICPECGHVHHHHHHDDECECGCHDHEHHHHHDEECECGCHDHEHHHHHDEDCECGHEHEHHHHHHHDEDCECGCHEHEHHHEHHHHDEECECGCHEHEHHHHEHHHHEHDEECECGHHHHHHHADDVFTSLGMETPHRYTKEELEAALNALANTNDYGTILRCKGIVASEGSEWYHFDLTPGEYEIRTGAADYTGRLCVIGTDLKEPEIKALLNI